MYRLLRALLFLLPAEAAHNLGIFTLRLLGSLLGVCRWLRGRALAGVDLEVRVGPLRWPHPIGLAAGMDKDAVAVHGLYALGFAAVEVGTLTPRPQPGNPKPRLFRLQPDALINRMGFNNQGARAAQLRIRDLRWRPGPLGVNLGKNKDTPLQSATEDYLQCLEVLAPFADYVVINASSPNTPGLRKLQEPEALASLLGALKARMNEAARGTPLLLKIAPDLGPEALDAVVDVALAARVDGLIATNTTLTRPVEHPLASEAGGLSGRPVALLSTEVIRRAYQRSEGKLPIIGVGGIFTAQDAYEKLRAGACAVQLYTGFVYQGPGVVGRMVRELAELLRRDGFDSVQAAVGADHRQRD
jgi:dihydroorotate dehydrogenase